MPNAIVHSYISDYMSYKADIVAGRSIFIPNIISADCIELRHKNQTNLSRPDLKES